MTALTGLDGGQEAPLDGEELTNMVSRLIAQHIGRVPIGDPQREHIEDWMWLGDGKPSSVSAVSPHGSRNAITAEPITAEEVMWMASDLIAAHIGSIPRRDPLRGCLKVLCNLNSPRWRR